MAFIPHIPVISTAENGHSGRLCGVRRLIRRSILSPTRHVSHLCRYEPKMMSGVNGGIDYEIDLSLLPAELSSRVRYVQQGPDSPTELIHAAKVIASSVLSYPSVLPVLVDMLGFNNPVAASICVSALASAGPPAIPPLLTGVAAFNYSVNAYALRALALIADPCTFDVCTACATKGPIPNVRRAACKALAALRFNDRALATKAFESLLDLARNEPDWGVRYAAVVAIEKFYALNLLEPNALQRATTVLKEAVGTDEEKNDSIGSQNEGDAKKASASTDPAVRARASVAVKIFENRLS